MSHNTRGRLLRLGGGCQSWFETRLRSQCDKTLLVFEQAQTHEDDPEQYLVGPAPVAAENRNDARGCTFSQILGDIHRDCDDPDMSCLCLTDKDFQRPLARSADLMRRTTFASAMGSPRTRVDDASEAFREAACLPL